MPDVALILDTKTGTLLVEDPDRLAPDARAALDRLVGPGVELGCARPATVLPPPVAATGCTHVGPTIRMAGYYHDSLVEGPGRRSCALLSGCDLGCPGCWVPHLHPADSGTSVCVGCLADALLDPGYERDGISLLGGEPFFQSEGLLALVQALRTRRCPHLLVYSGYTYERLQRMAHTRPAIAAILAGVDALIDGPFVQALANHAGPWTGSANQRVMTWPRRGDKGASCSSPRRLGDRRFTPVNLGVNLDRVDQAWQADRERVPHGGNDDGCG